ncbi:hypothetical protein I4U23_009274 [Adineta vaga]|nr:hypothetical protein I4U23_009274 [Adineta vaga]
MYTRTTVGIGRGPMSGSGMGYGANRPEMTIVVPWSAEFGAAYQQFVNGAFASPAGGMGGLGGVGGGSPFGGMSMGGMGGSPFGGMSMGGMGGSPFGGMSMGGGLPMGGGMPMGGYGGASMGGGLGGGNQIQGVPIGFGVTTGL